MSQRVISRETFEKALADQLEVDNLGRVVHISGPRNGKFVVTFTERSGMK